MKNIGNRRWFYTLLMITIFQSLLGASCLNYDNSSHNTTPGTRIAALHDVQSDKTICIEGASNKKKTERDYYYFRIGAKGTLSISGTSPNKHKYILKVGSTENGTEYYPRTKAKVHNVDTFDVKENDAIYLMTRGISTAESTYRLDFHFDADTPPANFDDENQNNDEPGETIAALDQVSSSATFVGHGSMGIGDWKDVYRFKPAVKGTYTITLNSDNALDMKAGKTYNEQEFFRHDSDEKTKTNIINVKADEEVSLTVFDGRWLHLSNNTYTLTVSFKPNISANISVEDANTTEGDKGKRAITFTVNLDQAAPQDLTLSYHTETGSAEDQNGNNDFWQKTGSVTIPKGYESTTITIDVDGDFQDEGDEQFYLILSDPAYGTFTDNNATGTILDDDDYDTSNHYSCETQAYIYASKQVRTSSGWDFSKPTDVRTIDLLTAKDKLIESKFYPDNINAIGYGVSDNFIWGIDIENHFLTRTDVNNNVITYKVDDLPDYAFHIGDVSADGILYVASAYLRSVDGVESNGIKRMYRIDVNPNSHTFLKMLPAIELSEQNLYSADWAFNPIDNQLYMVNRYDYDLIRIDPSDGEVTHLGSLLPYNYRDQGSHVQFFDRDGYFYFYADSDFYRVDITNPANPALTVKKYIHLPLTANGDAARCAYAPMENGFILDDIAQKEGNSGTTDMPFQLRLEVPAGAGGLDITYQTSDGSAKANLDYLAVGKTVHIPAGARTLTVNVPIIGDTEVENNETLFLLVSSPDFSAEANATGTIINDDLNIITFNATTTGSPLYDGNITTQIVNNRFAVQISATDENNQPVADVNITSIDLIKPDGTQLERLFIGNLITDAEGLASTTLTVTHIYPQATLKISGNYMKHGYTNPVKDDFAIRPDRFILQMPLVNSAGEKITMHLKAVDPDNTPTAAYNESIHDSFEIGYREQKSGCDTATINLNGIRFHDGIASKDINYSEIGVVDFNITEIPGSEFAKIDADDTPDAQRLITAAILQDVTFKPAGLEIVDWSLLNGTNNFTYYANMPSIDKMAAQLDIHLRVKNASGDVAKNYRSDCYAKMANIAVHFKTIGEPSQTDFLIWEDAKQSDHNNAGNEIPVTGADVAQQFVFDVDPGKFVNGETIEQIRINFKRDMHTEKEPLRLIIYDINATEGYGLSSDKPKNSSVDFYYGRLHAVDQIGVGEKMKIHLFHEVYCKKCDRKNIFTIAGGEESKDSIHWYIVTDANDGISGFSHVSGKSVTFENYVPGTISATTKPMINSDAIETIRLYVPTLPFTERISYQPVPWLLYNPFNNKTNHTFTVVMNPKPRTWAGRGDTGHTIDTNMEARGNSYLKMDW